jgi:hypothetical protein
MAQIVRTFYKTAGAEILAGTDLEKAPGNGTYYLYAGSDNITATVVAQEVTGQYGTEAGGDFIPLTETNGMPDAQKQPFPWQWRVRKGQTQKVTLGGTISKVFAIVKYVGS